MAPVKTLEFFLAFVLKATKCLTICFLALDFPDPFPPLHISHYLNLTASQLFDLVEYESYPQMQY